MTAHIGDCRDASRRFEPGRSYSVLRMDDAREVVTIERRNKGSVTLTDGRTARILRGTAPDGRDEEVIRLNEQGAVAGVVRACHLV